MNLVEVVRQGRRAEEMVTILSVCEVITGQVRTGHDDFVIHSIELHVLKTPAFVDTLGDDLLPETGEIGCVEHADFDSASKLGDQGRK